MPYLRSFLSIIFSQIFWKKLLAFTSIFLIGWTLSDFLALFFITFICAYIFLEFGTTIAQKVHDWGIRGKRDRKHRIAEKYATTNAVVSILYILFISAVVFVFISIVPKIGKDITDFVRWAPAMAKQAQEFISSIEASIGVNMGLTETVSGMINPKNIESIGQFALTHITNGGIILMKFLIGLVLSYIFIIERSKIAEFLNRMKHGNFSFFYDEYAIIAKRIGSGFGLIFKAQSIIALTNAILTSLWLILISILHGGTSFPYIITLSLIVFIFGFIPVFGTIISGIPIIIIAYGYGQLSSVVAVLIMISVVHMVEAYYLNPKIVSSYVHFPVFITFLILIISEHLFGLIGLLIGVPLFSIMLGLIEDLDHYIDTIRKELKQHSPSNPS